jgi:hypothetical protein
MIFRSHVGGIRVQEELEKPRVQAKLCNMIKDSSRCAGSEGAGAGQQHQQLLMEGHRLN